MRSRTIFFVALVLMAFVIVNTSAEVEVEPSAGCPDKPTEPCWWNNWQIRDEICRERGYTIRWSFSHWFGRCYCCKA
ncbi:hypothetical protein Ocin01_15082 [Orchesella cincta]|uniref:Uncharacterized protein n=1 Tax=Orchesella cincta TaxID=48709 RepID=A0A1D2MFG8_ORCCI|nr:hypothetical protein Ocin01_15082 [Orchesella cincta]